VFLHPKLKPFSGIKHARRFNSVVKMIDRDLRSVSGVHWDIEIAHVQDTSIWKRLYTTAAASDVEAVLTIRGRALEREFVFANSIGLGILHPYVLQIQLAAPFKGAFIMRRGALGLRAKWDCEPEFRQHLESLKGLRLPSVNFNHSWGHYKCEIPVGHQIAQSPESPDSIAWTISSGYQGFWRRGPRLAKYLEAAPRLEEWVKVL
jgi:hypothetical protein